MIHFSLEFLFHFNQSFYAFQIISHYTLTTLDGTVNEYSLDSFLEKISDNPVEIFGEQDQSYSIKIYLMVADDNWKTIFSIFNPTKLGDVYKFQMTSNNDNILYYLYELDNGLLMIITSSRRDEYEQTLRRFVRRAHGITEMWLPPRSFEEITNYIQSKYDANIYAFTARRTWSSQYPSKIREDFSRSIRYSGDDAGYSLKEMKISYGVLPTLIDFNIEGDKLRITNDGLFLLRSNNRKTLRIVEEVVDQVLSEQRRLRSVSKQVLTTKKSIQIGNNTMNVAKLMSGKILFNIQLDAYLVEKLFSNFQDFDYGHTEEGLDLPNFSFIDTNVHEGSVTFSATVIDEDKGTIFGISGNRNTMLLVPKHNITFESFLNFYRFVNQTIDESSNLRLFSEGNISR